MVKIQKPKVNTKAVAGQYSGSGEKIIEISFPDGTGCLICLFAGVNENRIDVYNIDAKIKVSVAPANKLWAKE